MNKDTLTYNYKLPENQQSKEYTTNNNSLIIIGANGSGKSKLGAWMEQQDLENIHRVSAQRSLNFGEFINLKSSEQAKNLLFYGNSDVNSYTKHKPHRWGDQGKEATTKLLNDYESVLSLIIAIKNRQNDDFIRECKERENQGQAHNNVPETVIDKLQRIWDNIFPQRKVSFDDAKVTTEFQKNGVTISYKGKEMSDGERVALYLMAQCLCIPENKTIIIDEPEIHLHRSIMNKLWSEIEKERPDCFFIYITHDTQFAANHKNADKVWTKSYDGEKWELEKINEQNNGLPEQLLLDIMGNRKKVLFVEGTNDSYDTKLYSEIYKDYYVVPCGGCSSVISFTKAMKNNSQLHHIECYGIIDRDYRTELEINSLKHKGIYVVDVAEVENLFLVEELLLVINNILFPDDNKVDDIKSEITEQYNNQIQRQICQAVVSELKFQLSSIDISNRNESTAKSTLEEAYKNISYDTIKQKAETIFESAKNDYKKVLKIYNNKGLSNRVEDAFGLKRGIYQECVIGQLKGDKANDIINAIKGYLPDEIPV